MPRHRKKYRGILGRPLNPYKEREANEALNARMKALFDWYKIDIASPDAYKRLAFALAFRHVDGFQFPETMLEIAASTGRRSGPKTVVPPDRHGEAIQSILELKERLGMCNCFSISNKEKFFRISSKV